MMEGGNYQLQYVSMIFLYVIIAVSHASGRRSHSSCLVSSIFSIWCLKEQALQDKHKCNRRSGSVVPNSPPPTKKKKKKEKKKGQLQNCLLEKRNIKRERVLDVEHAGSFKVGTQHKCSSTSRTNLRGHPSTLKKQLR